jgi:hypothetical protein
LGQWFFTSQVNSWKETKSYWAPGVDWCPKLWIILLGMWSVSGSRDSVSCCSTQTWCFGWRGEGLKEIDLRDCLKTGSYLRLLVAVMLQGTADTLSELSRLESVAEWGSR